MLARRSLACAAALALSASGCGGARDVEIAPPREVAWVVALLDRAGADTEVSGPHRLGSGVRIPIGEGGAPDTIRIAGYTEAQLAVFGAGPESGRAKLATGCDALMPEPIFAAKQDSGGDASSISPASLPPLSADGLTCPGSAQSEAIWVEVHCPALAYCRPAVVRDGCRLTMSFDDCGIAAIKGTVVARGDALCVPPAATANPCTPTEKQGDEWAALDCHEGAGVDCRVGFFRPPATPVLEVKTVPVLVGARPVIPAAAARGDRLAYDGREGYLADLAVLPDRVVVASYDGAVGGPWCSVSPDASKRKTRIHFFELESLMSTGTATAPDCLRMVADPNGAGFIGAFGAAGEFYLGKFDARGRMLQRSQRLAVLGDPSDHAVGPLELTDPPQAVALALTTTSTLSAQTTFAYYDARTLEPRGSVYIGRGHSRGLSTAGPGRMALLEYQLRRALLIGVDPARVQADFYPAQHGDEADFTLLFIGYSASKNEILLADAGLRRGILNFSTGGGIPSASPLTEYLSTPSALIKWPGAGDVHATTFLRWKTPSEPESVVTLFDSATRKYAPGAQRVGFGPTWRMRSDGRTRVYAIQPWSAELARITGR